MQEPRLPEGLEDGLTELFYKLTTNLQDMEGLLRTLNRFDILTDDEMRVIYHSSHARMIEHLRQHD